MLRFLGVIDEQGKPTEVGKKIFVQGDEGFSAAFSNLVRGAYEELFDLNGDEAWAMDRQGLTRFFREADQSSELVGTRQASTFQALAALSGYAEVPAPKPAAKKSVTAPGKTNAKSESKEKDLRPSGMNMSDSRFGLTVRVEVNLPADGDEGTYDMIFRSIRKNLIDAE